MKKALTTICFLCLVALTFQIAMRTPAAQLSGVASSSGAKVDPLLESYLSARDARAPAVITYDRKPGVAELDRLRAAGIMKGFALLELPMVISDMTPAQLAAVRSQPGVLSIWANRVMKNMTNESRRFIGATQTMTDGEITARNSSNPGLPISGRRIGIGYVDTGIDATHDDLRFGATTAQNVIQTLAQGVVSDPVFGLFFISISDLIADAAPGFVPPVYIENVPTSDLESGHGTHGAGIAAGTGASSGGFYGGVAPGAHLVGVNSGDDLGLPLISILAAYDYLLVNQFSFNIRVVNNSWGSSFAPSEVDPDNPINVATREAHDRNIVVVFAAGNGGGAADAINPYSTMPWTISVAAGEKRGLGSPAGFSSRGVDNGTGTDTAGQPADPSAPPNLRPDITAPGVKITSTRARTISPFLNAGSILDNDLTTIPPAFLPGYFSSDGTSFACPHVSGVAALILEANPTLTPDDVVTILRQTATPMPFEERVVGAGYVDAHNAVRKAMNLAPVAHPANLFPAPGGPEIVDAEDDQIGTTAQDILSGDFSYDASARQIVYTLTLADLSTRTPNDRWTMNSNFGATTVFVTAAITETGATTFSYGRITTLPTGTRNQQTLGPADSGEIRGNQVIVRLSIDKVNAAVGASVLFTTSTLTQASAQILLGTSVSGGLLLNADSAAGSDFKVGEPPPPPGGDGKRAGFSERLAGTLDVNQNSVEVAVNIRLGSLDAKLNYHPGDQPVTFQLLDPNAGVVATADQSGNGNGEVGSRAATPESERH